MNNEQVVIIGGMVVSSKKIMTRANQSMLFVKLEDETGSTEIIVFPNLLATSGDVWRDGQAVLCQGTISDKDNERKILADKAIYLTLDNLSDQLAAFRDLPGQKRRTKNGHWSNKETTSSTTSPIMSGPVNSLAEPFDLILNKELNQTQLVQLKEILLKYPGASQVYLEINLNGNKQRIATGFKVNRQPKLLAELMARLAGMVKF